MYSDESFAPAAEVICLQERTSLTIDLMDLMITLPETPKLLC